jgi:C-terminal processing protease CtpA/Prc
MTNDTSASDLGHGLYHAVWKLVSQTFFDTSRLVDWDSFEHRFDSEIVDEDSAVVCIDKMLDSLGDDFTFIQRAPVISVNGVPVTADNAAPTAEQAAPIMAVLRPDGIGYLRIGTLEYPNILDLIEAAAQKIANCQGVVLDLRNNIGGDVKLTAAACGSFLEEGLVATMETRAESGAITCTQYALSEDEFFANELTPGEPPKTTRWARSAPVLAGKPLVILISKRTTSAAELMTAALVQQGRPGQVLMVGTGPTPGKGIGGTNYTFLDGKYRVRITRVRWLTPGGDWLGDCGQTVCNPIEPDVQVPDDRGIEGVQVAFKELRKMLDAAKAAGVVDFSDASLCSVPNVHGYVNTTKGRL